MATPSIVRYEQPGALKKAHKISNRRKPGEIQRRTLHGGYRLFCEFFIRKSGYEYYASPVSLGYGIGNFAKPRGRPSLRRAACRWIYHNKNIFGPYAVLSQYIFDPRLALLIRRNAYSVLGRIYAYVSGDIETVLRLVF